GRRGTIAWPDRGQERQRSSTSAWAPGLVQRGSCTGSVLAGIRSTAKPWHGRGARLERAVRRKATVSTCGTCGKSRLTFGNGLLCCVQRRGYSHPEDLGGQ